MGDLLIFMKRLQEVAELLSVCVTSVNDILNELTDNYRFSNGGDFSNIEQHSITIAKEAASCWSSVCELSAILKINVPWLPENKENASHSFRYLDGFSPWSFWLILEQNEPFDLLYSQLQKAYIEGALRNYTSLPIVNSYVICVDKKSVFRALVLDSMVERIKVLNIDNGNSKVVQMKNVYYLTKEFCQLHAQIIHCCILEDTCLKSAWNDDLKDLFKSILRECLIQINVKHVVPESFPKKYCVEMTGFSSEIDDMVDFNDWICGRLLPEVKALVDNFVNVSLEKLGEKALEPWNSGEETSEAFNKREWSATLLDQPTASSVLMASCEPYPSVTESSTIASLSISPSSSNASSLSKILKCESEGVWNIDKIVEFKPSTSSSRILNIHSATFEPQNAAQGKIDYCPTGVTDTLVQQSTHKNAEICENLSSKGFCLSFDCSKLHIKLPDSSVV